MDKIEQFEREYYEAHIARNNKRREDPIALIHAIIVCLREYEADSYEVIERSIRRDWRDQNQRAMMEAEYQEYREEQTRKLERQRTDPPALRHAISEAVGRLFGSVARQIETGIRYEWRDNPNRRAEMEQDYEAAMESTKKTD